MKLRKTDILMYRVVNGDSPDFIKEVLRFCEENIHSLRHQNTFKDLIVNKVYTGTETSLFWGHKIWELIPCTN